MRVALHWSLCRDDALDAYQRALEIYLRRVDSLDPATETAWMKVVVKNEALAVRRARTQLVPVEEIDADGSVAESEQRPIDDLLAGRERVERSAEALRRIKPDEAKALILKAQGLSYAEIGEALGRTYTNVMSTVAVFVAVGGSSYAAVTLPRNSVGERQIKSRAVGKNELQRAAVDSRSIKNRSIRTADLARSARSELAGKQGPPGPPGASPIALRASIDGTGGATAGSPVGTDSQGPNKVRLNFGTALAGCVPTASLARNGGDPGAGRIVVGIEDNRVAVDTFTTDGTPAFLPFNVIVAC
jgi:RNA polymerase sigma factor (sigma-70 family)